LLVEGGHQGNVFPPAVVVIAGHIAGIAVDDVAGGVGESIPDGGTFAGLVPGPFNLVGGSGGTPQEIFGKSNGHSNKTSLFFKLG
jgi:hypothetical protein